MNTFVPTTIGSLAAPTKSSLATGPFGSSVSSKNFVTSGVPMLRGSNLSEDVGVKLVDDGLVYLDPVLASTFKRSLAKRGDLIFTSWGSVGQLGLIDESSQFDSYIVSNKQMKLTPDNEKVIPLFLYYYLSQPLMIQEVKSRAIGSTIPGFNLGQLRELPVELPSLKIQQAITEVLGALDDKIAANIKLAATSALLAQSLFAAASPGAHGFEIGLAESCSLLSRGITPKYATDDETMIVLNQKCVRGQRVDLAPARRTLLAKVRHEKVLRQNDVLVNSTGQGTLGRVARWTHDESVSVDSHITIVRFNPEVIDPVCGGFAMLRNEENITAMAEGSTGQTELSRVELGKLTLKLPPREQQQALGRQLAKMTSMENAHLLESQMLAKTRDALLPRLMSGQLSVKDAEELVTAAI